MTPCVPLEHTILYLLYAAVFVMCLIASGSILAALCILLPLVLVTELGHSLMVHLSIGMKVNTLCVVALGVGIASITVSTSTHVWQKH